MLEVHVEEAQAVKRGALLGRIETRTLDDARQSASSAVRIAENQLAVARREVERTEKLVNAGAIAARDLDLAADQRHARSRRSWPTPSPGWPAPSASSATRSSARRSAASSRRRPSTPATSSARAPSSSPSSTRRRCGSRRRCRRKTCRSCGRAPPSSSPFGDTIRRSRAASSASPRRPTRPRGRCRSSWPFPTSAGASSRACSPRGASWRSRRAASSCR